MGWTTKAKETFAATRVNSSLRKSIVPCNEAVEAIVARKIALFLGHGPAPR